MIECTDGKISPGDAASRLSIPEGTGSVVLHFAVVKPTAEGEPTAGVRFTRAGDVEGELRAIEENLRSNWNLAGAWLVRRTGEALPGEVISMAAAASANREDAFGACREAVEAFKEMRALRKEELYSRRAGREAPAGY